MRTRLLSVTSNQSPTARPQTERPSIATTVIRRSARRKCPPVWLVSSVVGPSIRFLRVSWPLVAYLGPVSPPAAGPATAARRSPSEETDERDAEPTDRP